MEASAATPTSFEDYLDSYVTDDDMKYLDERDMARQIVELGFKDGISVLSREEFEQRYKQNGKEDTDTCEAPEPLDSRLENDICNSQFLRAIAERMDDMKNEHVTPIVFLRFLDETGYYEISAYIDLASKIKQEGFNIRTIADHFKRNLVPNRDVDPSVLSLYNWKTGKLYFQSTSYFDPLTSSSDDANEISESLRFSSKLDDSIVEVDFNSPRSNKACNRIDVKANDYLQVVLFEHRIKEKRKD